MISKVHSNVINEMRKLEWLQTSHIYVSGFCNYSRKWWHHLRILLKCSFQRHLQKQINRISKTLLYVCNIFSLIRVLGNLFQILIVFLIIILIGCFLNIFLFLRFKRYFLQPIYNENLNTSICMDLFNMHGYTTVHPFEFVTYFTAKLKIINFRSY